LRDAEDALEAYKTDLITRDRTEATLQVAQRRYVLAKTRYSLGLANFLQILDTEQALVQTEQKLAQADFSVANDVVTLFAALGGGWQEGSVKIPAPEISAPLPPLPAALDNLGHPGSAELHGSSRWSAVRWVSFVGQFSGLVKHFLVPFMPSV
jgi:hypothetical protein